ncbi:hypothetical protein ES708_31880 [subsurface metagenome]
MARIDWKRVIIPKVKELVTGYSYRPTLRQVFYRLVAALLIPNTEVTYKGLSRSTVLAREEGTLNPLCFDDRIRTHTEGDHGYEGINSFLYSCKSWIKDLPEAYTRHLWTTQQAIPIIWLEKDALFTPVSTIAEPYRIKVYASRGYSSFTAIYQAAIEMNGEKPTKVLQLTDFDPSGEDMVRDLNERLGRYGAGDFEVEKIALTRDQVETLGLPPMPAKTSDPRYDRFAASYGEECVELDALPPDELESIVRDAIEGLINQEAWDARKEKIEEEREKVEERIDKLTQYLDELDEE